MPAPPTPAPPVPMNPSQIDGQGLALQGLRGGVLEWGKIALKVWYLWPVFLGLWYLNRHFPDRRRRRYRR